MFAGKAALRFRWSYDSYIGVPFFRFCSNMRIACPTWNFERHAEINLHDWDVFHSWSFLVHLHIKEFISKRFLPYMSVTTFIKYPVQWKWLPTQSNYWRRWAYLLRRWRGLDVEWIVGLLLLSGFSPLVVETRNIIWIHEQTTLLIAWAGIQGPDLLTVSLRRLILILSQWQH